MQQQTGKPAQLLRFLLSRGLDNDAIRELLHAPPLPALLPWQIPGIPEAMQLLAEATATGTEVLIVNQSDTAGLFAAGLLARVSQLLGTRWTAVHLPEKPDLLLEKLRSAKTPPLVLLPVSVPVRILQQEFFNTAEKTGARLILLETCFPEADLPARTIRIHPPRDLPQITLTSLAAKLGEALLFSGTEWYNKEILIYDLETTGLKPEQERIIEIAGIRAVNGAAVAEFSSLANPGMQLQPIITDLTGITQPEVDAAPDEAVVLKQFLEFGKDAAALSGHNIKKFDNRFIEARCRAFGYQPFHQRPLDTLELSRQWLPGLRNHKLATVAEALGHREANWHRALADVRASMQILYFCLLARDEKITRFRSYAAPFITVNALLALHVSGENRYFLRNCLDREIFTNHPFIRSLLKQVPDRPGIDWTRRNLLVPLTLLGQHHRVMLFNAIAAGNEISTVSPGELQEAFATNGSDRRTLMEQYPGSSSSRLPVYRLPNRPLSYLTALDRMLEMISPHHLLLSPHADGTVIGQLTTPEAKLLQQWTALLQPGEITDKTAMAVIFTVAPEREQAFLQQVEAFSAAAVIPERIAFSTRINCREQLLCPFLKQLLETGPYGHDFPAPLILIEEVPLTVINNLHPPALDLHSCRLVFHTPAWRSLPPGEYLLDLLVRFQGGDGFHEYNFFTVDFRRNPFAVPSTPS